MANHNQTLGIKPLTVERDQMMENFRKKYKEAWTHDWFFSGWEKILIIVCFVWTTYSLGSWLWSLI